ncbi:NTP transferase domain-containing protein [Sulfobacillus sp. DSM 109850]|uniref:NTP transferase domain-containing protein n=1 Tax=Sulfobacillus harzensis TaxID=2729629 RepID=A0A7Y0L672_9FIRM|nr:NTP transferase domain-containing protein [Sulfobacillus harzensis]
MLAAGLASRLAFRSKPDLLWVGDETLLQHQVATSQAAGFHTLVVSRLPRPEFWSVVNLSAEQGLSRSIHVGLQEIRRKLGSVAVGVLLADQPFVTASDIRAVWHAFSRRPPGVHAVRARYGAVPGHPVFFDPAWDSLVEALTGDRGLGALWRERSDGVFCDVEVKGRPQPSFDIDTESAYHQALMWAREEA